jgi:hypothetical protein
VGLALRREVGKVLGHVEIPDEPGESDRCLAGVVGVMWIGSPRAKKRDERGSSIGGSAELTILSGCLPKWLSLIDATSEACYEIVGRSALRTPDDMCSG